MVAAKFDLDRRYDLLLVPSEIGPTRLFLKGHHGFLLICTVKCVFLPEDAVDVDVKVELARVNAIELDLCEH